MIARGVLIVRMSMRMMMMDYYLIMILLLLVVVLNWLEGRKNVMDWN